MYWNYVRQGLFRKKQHPGIGCLVKKCPSEKLFFLDLNQKCQKQRSALLSNKDALLLKRQALFQEQFQCNSFHFK